MSDHPTHHDAIGGDGRERLDAYLDGLLTPDERTEFERHANTSPALHREIALQRRVDTAIAAAFPVPSEETLRRLGLGETAAPAVAESGGAGGPFMFGWRQMIAVAASLLVTALGVWLVVRAVGPRNTFDPYAPQDFRTIARVFQDKEADRFLPEVVCRDADEFASWFQRQFGQSLQLPDPMPSEAVALGLGYSHTVSPWTIYVLMEIAGEPVIVFVDQVSSDDGLDSRVTGDLHVDRAVVDELVLYAVSREDTGRVAELFYNPGDGSGDGPGEGQETGG